MKSMLKKQSLREEFDQFYQFYKKQVYYSAYKITKDHFLAQDVVQETFTKAFRHYDELSNEKIKRAWLSVTSRNAAIDMYRKRCRSSEISDDCVEFYAGTVQWEDERYVEMKFIRELLYSLEPLNRQAIFFIYEYGLTYEELACVQKSSVSAVKSRIHRAKLKMRSMVQE